MKKVMSLILVFVASSAMAATGPGDHSPHPTNPPPPQWPPSSPQTNNCGGSPCLPQGGSGPQNGHPYGRVADERFETEGAMPRCGWGAAEFDDEGRPLCFDTYLDLQLCEDVSCE